MGLFQHKSSQVLMIETSLNVIFWKICSCTKKFSVVFENSFFKAPQKKDPSHYNTPSSSFWPWSDVERFERDRVLLEGLGQQTKLEPKRARCEIGLGHKKLSWGQSVKSFLEMPLLAAWTELQNLKRILGKFAKNLPKTCLKLANNLLS